MSSYGKTLHLKCFTQYNDGYYISDYPISLVSSCFSVIVSNNIPFYKIRACRNAKKTNRRAGIAYQTSSFEDKAYEFIMTIMKTHQTLITIFTLFQHFSFPGVCQKRQMTFISSKLNFMKHRKSIRWKSVIKQT